MTSPQDPNVPSTVRRTLGSDVTTKSDDLSDAWTLWAEKELAADERTSTGGIDSRGLSERPSNVAEAVPPTPRGQLPQREARQVVAERERSRTASSEDLLEERAAATSSSGVGAVGLASAAAVAAGVSTKAGDDIAVVDDSTSTIADKVESAPPTVRVTELDKQALPDRDVPTGDVPTGDESLSVDPTDDVVVDRPVADRQMVGDHAGHARFERVDSVEADEDSSPRIGWLILAALICAGLVGALMWFGLPGSSEDDPTSDSGTTGATSDVTSPTQTTAPALTGTTAVTGAGVGAVGAGAGAGAATIGGAGTLTLNTTSVAFGMGETSKGIVIRNMGTAAVNWSAIGPANAVTLTPASGTLEPGAIAVVQIGRGIQATLGQTAQVQISAGPGAAPQVVTVTF